jgi:pimeloyl-ACP methyl ester carboxylesterase
MGGLVARHCIRLQPDRVRRCVTIASPHSGVGFHRIPIVGRGGRQLRAGTRFLMELSGAPLGVPMLSIFSTHDNIVAPAHTAASLEPWGGRDFVVDHVGHLTILFDKRVATAVADFLVHDPPPTPPTYPSTKRQTAENPSKSRLRSQIASMLTICDRKPEFVGKSRVCRG